MIKQQFLLFRFLTSLIFIYAGVKHLTNPTTILKRISAGSVYNYLPYDSIIKIVVLLTGLLMIIGAVAMVLHYKVKTAATLLLLIIIGITLTVQLENLNDLGPFFKNIAIIGSLLLIINMKKNENSKNPYNNNSHTTKPGIIWTKETTVQKR